MIRKGENTLENTNDYINKIHYTKDGKIDKIYNSLTCIEKIEYLLLNNRKYKFHDIFCNNFNLTYVRHHDNCSIYCSSKKKSPQFITFYKEEEKINIPQFLSNKLKTKPIPFSTRFDLLPSYYWYYEETGKINSSGHICLLVGESNNFYYFLEDPTLLYERKNQRLSENADISIIKKNILHRAFQEKAEFYDFKINNELFSKVIDITNIGREIIHEYYDGIVSNNEEDIIYSGRIAIEQLIQYFNKNFEFKEILAAVQWQIHLIASRLFLFRLHYEDEKNDISQYFKSAEKEWLIFKTTIMKSNTSGKSLQNKNVQKILYRILDAEDQLMEEWKKLLFS